MIIERRSLIRGLVSVIAAPPIVRVSSLMSIRGTALFINQDKVIWYCGSGNVGLGYRGTDDWPILEIDIE